MRITLHTTVDGEGHLPLLVRRRLQTVLLRARGRAVTVTVTPQTTPRSLSANSRYWSLLHCGAEALGYDSPADLHDACAMHLLRIEDDPLLHTPRRRSTRTLDTAEFSGYVDAVARLLVEYGADLTDWQAAC